MFTILQGYGTFNESHALLFEKKIKIREIEKDEILLKQGEISSSIYYILEGSFYQYTTKNEIEQNVIDLHLSKEWFLNQKSFVNQKPSEAEIVAFSKSKIIELTVQSMHDLIAQSPAFFQLGKILDQSHSKIHFFDNTLTPLQKYEYILKNRPQLIQTFPLKIIASYLKITPETLSRVREKLAKSGS
jgi:CRP-like cAMP-binding protein